MSVKKKAADLHYRFEKEIEEPMDYEQYKWRNPDQIRIDAREMAIAHCNGQIGLWVRIIHELNKIR